MKNNIIAEFEERINELIGARPLPEMTERFKLVELLNEEFYLLTEQTLPNTLLTKLSNWLLLEVLNDKDVDKVTKNEFAIFSERQLKRRDKRENSTGGELIDYLNQKYTYNQHSLHKKSKKGGGVE